MLSFLRLYATTSLFRRHSVLSFTTTTIRNNNNNAFETATMAAQQEDEFGDDSFLDDFDIDAAVSAITKKSTTPAKENPYDKNEKKRSHQMESLLVSSSTPMKKIKAPSIAATTPTFSSLKQFSTAATSISTLKQQAALLEDTLEQHFGFSSFRKGQLEVIQNLLEGRDAAVFWSTGSGKSLCYQIPPLFTGRIALVISPLISLMEDQVAKLNGLMPGKAVFLGSGQTDPQAEERALRGDYLLVYCTPEKLTSSDWFLDRLSNLDLCLIAIDESHCVSEWGHDFRPSYRQIGDRLRLNSKLSDIPMVAVTATAVPRVQRDILQSLYLRQPLVVQQSFDRSNLIIGMKRKPKGGYSTALKSFVQELDSDSSKNDQSTIIYCPTQSMVTEVSEFLQRQFNNLSSAIQVQSYHGGQSIHHRSDAHINFLTGKTHVIVATLAFGMGIDKTDIRRIIHYGPPKTVEEYYQQIGRAGRDGRDAQCIMYCDANDFDGYKTDFYLGKLRSAEHRTNIEHSIDALRSMSMSSDVCRRASILKFFHEIPTPFGDRCGTCDTCRDRKRYEDDRERDFGPDGARLVLYAISVLNSKQGIGTIEKVLNGNTKAIEKYRYSNSTSTSIIDTIPQRVMDMKRQMKGCKKRVPVTYFTKDLLPVLVEKNYVVMTTNQATHGSYGRQTSWTGYSLTSQGRQALLLNSTETKIMLPVPASIREYEEEQKKKMEARLQELQTVGVDVKQIPKEELEEGDGIVLKALQTWFRYLEILKKNDRNERLAQLKDLRSRIETWRMDVATNYRIAPADVMPEHLLLSVAYAVASMKEGKMEKQSLLAVGIRSGGIDQLITIINDWLSETIVQPTETSHQNTSSTAEIMIFTDDNPYVPSQAWEHFVYRPNKKTGLASWESSYNRFMIEKEHPQTIAMSPANGKPIQIQTVTSHIFDGMMSGRPVDLKRLSTISPPPTRDEWDVLSKVEAENASNGMDITGDPKTSGRNGEAFRLTDFLEPILGISFTSKEYADRTEEESQQFGKWCKILKWYMSLRRNGYVPTFTAAAAKKKI